MKINKTAYFLALAAFGVIALVMVDNFMVRRRLEARMDKDFANMVLMALVAHGWKDEEIFGDFSAERATTAALNQGIQVKSVNNGGMPLHSGSLIGYGLKADGSIFAKIKSDDGITEMIIREKVSK